MRLSPAVHDALADLLEYPRAGDGARAPQRLAAVAAEAPVAAAFAAAFADFAATTAIGDWEEIYVRTFDGNVERALEVGWQVFGEQYARGVFLVRMRELIRACGVTESSELPDHLTHVLRVLGRTDEATASMIATSAVRPSLTRILADLPQDDPYAALLRAVSEVVASHETAAAPAAGGAA